MPDPLVKLPGFGLPVSFLPNDKRHFPMVLGNDSDFKANTLTNRELCMLRFMEEITNKPDWWIKVHDDSITTRWKAEVLKIDWDYYLKHGDFTSTMADACIEELKFKSKLYEHTNLIPIYDYSAAIIKSDRLVTKQLWEALKNGVKALEDIPDEAKDWHPGSNGTVLNLVHPSLCPLVYGESRIVSDRIISVTEALGYCGKGEVIQRPSKKEIKGDLWHCTSTNFQWLPCDISVQEGCVKIESYINNLHPVKHSALYTIIEGFIEKALPAWDIVYRWPTEFSTQRLTTDSAMLRCKTRRTCANSVHGCSPLARPTLDDEPRRSCYAESYSDSEAYDSGTDSDPDLRERHVPRLWRAPKMKINTVLRTVTPDTDLSGAEYESEEYNSAEDEAIRDWDSEEMNEDEEMERDPSHVSEDEVKRRDLNWFSKTHPLVMPEPSAKWHPKIRAEDVRERDFFRSILPETGPRRLQVIVKLANIHLTPDTPTYPGGSWHIEGQINEHICATALFYYDNENITDSYIDFRTRSNGDGLNEGNLKYAQNDRKSIQRIFAIEENYSTIQAVGSVLTREGRALFFPNVFQHHLSSFKLADFTRHGHRKILALFLVDPAIPIISTANVPPQLKDWWPEELVTNSSRFGLPFDTEKAREYRKELMQERSANEWTVIDKMKHVEWNFCEH